MLNPPLPLEPIADSIHPINRNAWISSSDDLRAILFRGVPLLHYSHNDKQAEAFAIASLAIAGLAKATDLARAFDKSRNTVAAYRRRIEQGGTAELLRLRRGPKGAHKVQPSIERAILKLKSKGMANTRIASRLGLSDMTVGRLLRRKGWSDSKTSTRPLPGMEAAPHAAQEQVMADAPVGLSREVHEAVEPRVLDRALAAVGVIQQADPELVSGRDLRCLGALTAIPVMMETGFLEVAERVYGRMRNAFYGLTSTMLTLFLMALLRIRRPESLKEQPPEVLGRLLGLDRAPEVKTLRRKLRELGQRSLAHQFLRGIAQRIASDHEDVLGYLYVDGHVRVYHGTRKLPKVFSQKRHMILPATSDYWVNDANGDPFFFITTEGNPFLNRAFSRVLDSVRDLLGSRPVTFIFDRGGWSAELFRTLRRSGYHFITYRKQRYRKFPRTAFQHCVLEQDGKRFEYQLADRVIRLKHFGMARCVARLDAQTGHQIHIVTTRTDLGREEIARRMFRRWRQENFLKYMTQNYALDALVSYDLEPADPQREIANPAKTKVSSEIRVLRKTLSDLHSKLGLLTSRSKEPARAAVPNSMRKTLSSQISKFERQILALKKKRSALPSRIKVGNLPPDSQFRLETERKILTDTVKIIAYRVESALLGAIRPYYSRSEHEGRQLIQEIFQSSGDLKVHRNTVTVTLEPLSSPHRTQVLIALCRHLTGHQCRYPGSNQQLTFQVRGCTIPA
jgi:DNA-binding CsgD family transcriptional regulator